jgi:predicted RNA binding protein YcfA (HicA-like mRNA interferase family)
MSKIDKLIERLCKKPKDFTWDELNKILTAKGFEEQTTGKTGGSRRRFFNPETNQVVTLHKPHPENTLKEYVLKNVIEVLGLK